MHHPRQLLSLLVLLAAPAVAMAQASPFMTGATALQTNARVAREYLVALPIELSPGQRLGLVQGFSRELCDRYGFAIDLAIHAPRDYPGSDPRNFHAHMLATTREIASEGLGPKTSLEMNDSARSKLGLKPAIHELLHVRERWATATNEALNDAQIAARIDHRSLAAQGIDREPRPHIPRAAFEMERHGYRSILADRIRAEYATRLQARLGDAAGREDARSAGAVAGKPQSLEDLRREARENWLRLRQDRTRSTEFALVPPTDRGRDDDLAR